MLLLIIAYLGGALTIVSPCILPVLPFVFARAVDYQQDAARLRPPAQLLAGAASSRTVSAT